VPSERVVLMSPALDQDLCLQQRIEEFAVERKWGCDSVPGTPAAALPPPPGPVGLGDEGLDAGDGLGRAMLPPMGVGHAREK
jgi:hypothetical protein